MKETNITICYTHYEDDLKTFILIMLKDQVLKLDRRLMGENVNLKMHVIRVSQEHKNYAAVQTEYFTPMEY